MKKNLKQYTEIRENFIPSQEKYLLFFAFFQVHKGRDGRQLTEKKNLRPDKIRMECVINTRLAYQPKLSFCYTWLNFREKVKLFQTALKCYNTEHIKPLHSLTKETAWTTFWQFLDQSVQFYTYPSLHLIPTGIHHFKTRDPRPRLSLLYK